MREYLTPPNPHWNYDHFYAIVLKNDASNLYVLCVADGTEQAYSHMDFTPGDGKLLASVGGDPDYMLTVWDWLKQNIVLRSKAFSQDIYRVTFSPDNPQQLTTSGTGHIRSVFSLCLSASFYLAVCHFVNSSVADQSVCEFTFLSVFILTGQS